MACRNGREIFSEFCWDNLKERDRLEDLEADRVIIFKIDLNKEIKYEVLDYIYLAKDQNSWRMQRNFGCHKMTWHSWQADELLEDKSDSAPQCYLIRML